LHHTYETGHIKNFLFGGYRFPHATQPADLRSEGVTEVNPGVSKGHIQGLENYKICSKRKGEKTFLLVPPFLGASFLSPPALAFLALDFLAPFFTMVVITEVQKGACMYMEPVEFRSTSSETKRLRAASLNSRGGVVCRAA
jgi:hypothetical protein